MTRLHSIARLSLCLVLGMGCSESEPDEAPHDPVLPTPIVADEDEGEPEPAEEQPAAAEPEAAEEHPTAAENAAEREGKAKTASTKAPVKQAPKPTSKDEPAKPPKAEATEAKPKEAPAAQAADDGAKDSPESPQPSQKTRIPNDAHVQVIVTPAMQARLDSDSRMQGWINKVMAVAKQCYGQVRAQDATAGGMILVQVTMHENSRPTPDIQQLPPKLSKLVACSTGKLFNIRMPLFTGPEGEKHVVKLRFKP